MPRFREVNTGMVVETEEPDMVAWFRGYARWEETASPEPEPDAVSVPTLDDGGEGASDEGTGETIGEAEEPYELVTSDEETPVVSEPVRPKGNRKAEWVEYATALGHDVAGMNVDEIKALVG